jgi:hypothetical protein
LKLKQSGPKGLYECGKIQRAAMEIGDLAPPIQAGLGKNVKKRKNS